MRGEGGEGVCAPETQAQVSGSMTVPAIERGCRSRPHVHEPSSAPR